MQELMGILGQNQLCHKCCGPFWCGESGMEGDEAHLPLPGAP